MKPNLNEKYFGYNHTCTSCHHNHITLEEIREKLQQLKQELLKKHPTATQISIEIDDFLGENQQ